MINDAIKREKKLQELLKITNISEEEEVAKLDFKEKQKYFKVKSIGGIDNDRKKNRKDY